MNDENEYQSSKIFLAFGQTESSVAHRYGTC